MAALAGARLRDRGVDAQNDPFGYGGRREMTGALEINLT